MRITLFDGQAAWRGGHGVKPIRKPIDGVCLVPEFKDLFDCLSGWRSAKESKPAV
ncbi:MAG: hypothetical protein ACYC39_09740 [Thiobacillus sp.]|nr:hypothetical protein [Thiobacillus sp.]